MQNNDNFYSTSHAHPAIVIPAYQPDQQLVLLVQELRRQRPNLHIIVVNDGSDASLRGIFDALTEHAVDVLHHPINMGKGQALKTAFNHYLTVAGEAAIGVVTADADGQHSVECIIAVVDAMVQTPHHLHLGVRDFSGQHIPLRSKIGNTLTGFLFRKISRSNLYDTQTGLRGVPSLLMKRMVNSKLRGYELELEMLLLTASHQIPINQIAINTIYINNNATSHFNPLVDSLKIYWVLLRHSVVSIWNGFRRKKN